tara:strand:+ start:2253 stop:2774 length:522 start_codon:yes stop_codon:yes gene_type:complete
MIPVETWFPVVTLLAGTSIGGVLEALRDNRALHRETIAREHSRLETDRLRKLEFQKGTLIELQDQCTILTRQIGQMHHHDMTTFYRALQEERWGVAQLPNGLSDAVLSSTQQVGKLQARVADDTLRHLVSQLTSIYAQVSVAKSEEASKLQMTKLSALIEALNSRVGQLLREA